jgi:hypothetical protein
MVAQVAAESTTSLDPAWLVALFGVILVFVGGMDHAVSDAPQGSDQFVV